jgi:hypothetical protein
MRSTDDSSPQSAGRSAQREYERRHAARRQRAKDRYGLLGGLVARVTADPAAIESWQQGAGGELATARELAWHLRRSDVIVIHDRRIPGRGRANIDHLAIGPGGITVIDTKSSRGNVQLTSAGILHRREVLLVNGRDRSGQLDAVERQIDVVVTRLGRRGVAGINVLGALCFPYMRRPLLHNGRARQGLITVDDPRHVARFASRSGASAPVEVERLADLLASEFPPAAVAGGGRSTLGASGPGLAPSSDDLNVDEVQAS